MRKTRKAISPIIATVILVAVTLVIAVAIVGWLMGLWGGLAGGSPAIQITNQILYTNGTLQFYLKNTGGGSDVILSAQLLKNGAVAGSNTTFTLVGTTTGTSPTVPANWAGWVKVDFSKVTLKPGDTVIIKLYFKTSGTQQFQVTATS